MERLQIKSFAGLKDVTFQVSPVTGLIGPQASGKSVTAKLLYFFREIASRLPRSVIDENSNVEEYKNACLQRFRRYFPIEKSGNSDFEIIYFTNDEKVRVVFNKEEGEDSQNLGLVWSDFYPNTIKTLSEGKKKALGSATETDKEALEEEQNALLEDFYARASQSLGRWSTFQQIFIPAGRAFFSQTKASVFTSLASGEALDPFLVEFGATLETSKRMLQSRGFFGPMGKNPLREKRNERLRAEFREILRADLLRLENEDFFQYQDGRLVKCTQASSGQQEVLPLLFLLARFISAPHQRGRAVYIEEPEAHLFPFTQRQIVEFMARAFRARDKEMSLIITTHSPYILTSMNNLIQAGKLYELASPELFGQLSKIVPEESSLRPGEVGFYALDGGDAKSIMEKELGLIDAPMIDRVSDDIAIQFDKLLLAEGNAKP
jgi:hypothetical protein